MAEVVRQETTNISELLGELPPELREEVQASASELEQLFGQAVKPTKRFVFRTSLILAASLAIQTLGALGFIALAVYVAKLIWQA